MLKSLIPKQLHYALSDIKNSLLGGYGHPYYSQFGEDIALARLLREPRGYYVDVGAHHPKRYSNTYALYRRGWSGINIDPNPYTISLFVRARPSDVNLCIAAGGKEETLEYHRFSDPAVNTFNAGEAEKWKGKNWISYLGSQEIPVRPLRDILSSIETMPRIDLLSVDAEGMDLEILESNDWQKYIPRVIVVECNDFDAAEPHRSPTFTFLSRKGYALRGICGPSLIFEQK